MTDRVQLLAEPEASSRRDAVGRPRAFALGWGTAAAPFQYDQGAIARWLARGRDERAARRIRAAFRGTQIEARASCLPDFADGCPAPRLFRGASPSTAERMEAFAREAPPLACAAAERAIAAAGVDPGRITHLFTVTCTGFVAPGVDCDLAETIGLSPGVRRVLFGFQGCSAGLAALRTAAEIVRGDPRAVVLVVAVELCSLHFQPNLDDEDLRGHALFADGAGAAVVGARPSRVANDGNAPPLELRAGRSLFLPGTRDRMSWRISDTGFLMRLSADLPERLGEILPSWIDGSATQRWAVHPGGPAVLDRVESSLGLPPTALAASRRVLRTHGNMSSATIFFVFEELLRHERSGPGSALAFGPGLLVEALSFR